MSIQGIRYFAYYMPLHLSAVYAITSAKPYEPSCLCYLDRKRNVYLGDVFSVNWMEDSDKVSEQIEYLA